MQSKFQKFLTGIQQRLKARASQNSISSNICDFLNCLQVIDESFKISNSFQWHKTTRDSHSQCLNRSMSLCYLELSISSDDD